MNYLPQDLKWMIYFYLDFSEAIILCNQKKFWEARIREQYGVGPNGQHPIDQYLILENKPENKKLIFYSTKYYELLHYEDLQLDRYLPGDLVGITDLPGRRPRIFISIYINSDGKFKAERGYIGKLGNKFLEKCKLRGWGKRAIERIYGLNFNL